MGVNVALKYTDTVDVYVPDVAAGEAFTSVNVPVLAGVGASVRFTVHWPPLGPGTVPVRLNAVRVIGTVAVTVSGCTSPVAVEKTASWTRWTMVSVLP